MSSFESDLALTFKGHITITNDSTGEVLLDRDNDIHSQNMARIVARALSNEQNSTFYRLAFGNGGTFQDIGNNTIFRLPNDGDNGGGWESRLYQEIYSEIIDDLDNSIGTDPGSAGPDNVRVGGGAIASSDPIGSGVTSEEIGTRSKITIIMYINEDEPVGLDPFSFDEIGIYAPGKVAISTSGTTSINVGNKNSQDIVSPALSATTYAFNLTVDGLEQLGTITIPSSSPTYGDVLEGINTGTWSPAGPANLADTTFLYITDISGGTYPSIQNAESFGALIAQSKSTGINSIINFDTSPTLLVNAITYPNLFYIMAGNAPANMNLNTVNGQDVGVQNDQTTPVNERERLLTHLVFNPIEKEPSTIIRIVYTMVVGVGSGVSVISELAPGSTPATTPDSTPVTPTPTSSVTPTATPTVTVTTTVTPTISDTPAVTPTATVTVTPTVTPTNTLTATVTVTPTISDTPAVTPTATVTVSPALVTPTLTPTNTVTPTVTPTITPTNTITPTVTSTVTVTPTITPSSTIPVEPNTNFIVSMGSIGGGAGDEFQVKDIWVDDAGWNAYAVGEENITNGYLLKVDRVGAVVWQRHFASQRLFSTLKIGSFIYAFGDGAAAYKFDLSGTLIWQKRISGTGATIITEADTDGSSIYVMMGKIAVKTDTDFNVIWATDVNDGGASSLSSIKVSGGKVYVGGNRFVHKLDATTGSLEESVEFSGGTFLSVNCIAVNGSSVAIGASYTESTGPVVSGQYFTVVGTAALVQTGVDNTFNDASGGGTPTALTSLGTGYVALGNLSTDGATLAVLTATGAFPGSNDQYSMDAGAGEQTTDGIGYDGATGVLTYAHQSDSGDVSFLVVNVDGRASMSGAADAPLAHYVFDNSPSWSAYAPVPTASNPAVTGLDASGPLSTTTLSVTVTTATLTIVNSNY